MLEPLRPPLESIQRLTPYKVPRKHRASRERPHLLLHRYHRGKGFPLRQITHPKHTQHRDQPPRETPDHRALLPRPRRRATATHRGRSRHRKRKPVGGSKPPPVMPPQAPRAPRIPRLRGPAALAQARQRTELPEAAPTGQGPELCPVPAQHSRRSTIARPAGGLYRRQPSRRRRALHSRQRPEAE